MAFQWAHKSEMFPTGATALSSKEELDSSFLKCFSVVLRYFFGNQPYVCGDYCDKHWLTSISAIKHHRQFQPHMEGDLFSVGSSDRAAARLATVP